MLKMFMLACLIFISGCSYGTFNNGASAFFGVDYTKNVSPMCRAGNQYDHTNSNMGLKYHLFNSNNDKLKLDVKYTHHSCVIGPDAAGYDGIGTVIEYELF